MLLRAIVRASSAVPFKTPADGFLDCIPGGEETVDVRPAHAEFRGNVGYGRLVMTYTTEVLLRHLLDACTHVFAICPRSDRIIHGCPQNG